MKTRLLILILMVSVCTFYAQRNGYTNLEQNLDGVSGLQIG
ncbi:MAG TPA: hypothetical protein PLS84_07690 [Salinivirgaceae bacterium]|jgi:hypothetical protein|nr:hypothetical protein [Salinivirgaceae bacterium]